MKIQNFRFEGVCFKHEGHDPILQNTDFNFPENEVSWVQSEEGEGKSTVLQLIAALQLPQLGSFYINDTDIKELTFEEFLPYRLKIGYSFDYGGLINNQTLRENLMLPLRYHKLLPSKEAHKLVDELINRFDFKKFAGERPAHVPGRMRKLTCLLRALVHKPDLLVMDDPFVGLGGETAENFVALIKEMREQGNLNHIVLSSYDDKYVQSLRPRVIHLDQGQLYLSVTDGGKTVVNL